MPLAAASRFCERVASFILASFPNRRPNRFHEHFVKTPEEIEKMRVAGRLAAEVLDYLEPFVKAGVTTDELDRLCHDYMVHVQGCVRRR